MQLCVYISNPVCTKERSDKSIMYNNRKIKSKVEKLPRIKKIKRNTHFFLKRRTCCIHI